MAMKVAVAFLKSKDYSPSLMSYEGANLAEFSMGFASRAFQLNQEHEELQKSINDTIDEPETK